MWFLKPRRETMTSKKFRWAAIACAVAACAVLLADAGEAQAQGYRRGGSSRYTPARPTFGEAFNYARGDVGLLTPYQTFVQPQRQLRYALDAQQSQIATQQSEIARLTTDLETATTGASATGKGGSYMNYSHYYKLGSRNQSLPSGRTTGGRTVYGTPRAASSATMAADAE
jgi:hypothetical protein